ncbi:EVE domain-containing protein [Methanospirillum sp.]|uniref:EVE domain-containing protein n=1 Tax=Methanospirillum sp. TaxID=45200 RepID=UPI0035A05FB2
MTYWIASTNRTNWEIVRQKNIWGIPKRNVNIHSRVKPKDHLLIFTSQQKEGDNLLPSAITASYEITQCMIDDTPLFTAPAQMGDEFFPYRFKLKPIKIFKESLEFKPLIPDLQFITNKNMWTGHLRVAMREIPEEDYSFIMQKGDS